MNQQSQLVKILEEMPYDQRKRFVDRFVQLEGPVRNIDIPRRNCYNCGNRSHAIFSGFRGIKFDHCRRSVLLGELVVSYCEILMVRRDEIKSNCPEWTERITLWQRVKRMFGRGK